MIDNLEEAVVEEKKIEEMDVVFLMDRFGYAKTVDVATYERNKEAANTENRYILTCKNTDKICIFTNKGQMHLLKVLDLPYGKFRDKGTPIDNLSNYNSSEENLSTSRTLRQSAIPRCCLEQNLLCLKSWMEVSLTLQNEPRLRQN